MSLAKIYCNELIKELDKIPVFLPGTPVDPGDIITFGRSRPIGSFTHISTLSSLGIDLATKTDKDPDPYLYASKGGVGLSFTASADAGTTGKGKLEISFKKEASTYFAAVDCTVTYFEDQRQLSKMLEPFKQALNWRDSYIVTAVTMAKKALIMQANSQSASLVIEGDVKGLQVDGVKEIKASSNVKINQYKDASLIKDWSDNVTVFFSLARFRKKLSGDWVVTTRKTRAMVRDTDVFELYPVYPEDLLEVENE